jgi:hypothetical protein
MIKRFIIIALMLTLTSCAAFDTMYQIPIFKVTNFEHSTDATIGALYKVTGINSRGQEEVGYIGNARKTIENKQDTILGVCFTMVGFKDKIETDEIFRVSNYYPVTCPTNKK